MPGLVPGMSFLTSVPASKAIEKLLAFTVI
jgi:hypothetical protein